jgi:hypothetical protein
VLGAAEPSAEAPHFWNTLHMQLGNPSVDSIRNRNGSPRIENAALYAKFRRDHGAALEQWANDPRLNLNPNFVIALVAKESGFDSLAVSSVPAFGIAQMTHIADADLVQIANGAPAFKWMSPEVLAWPRATTIHDSSATQEGTMALLESGAVDSGNEYLFDPGTALRASEFWLRILATIWTEDEWPGAYGSLARSKLGVGQDGRLREDDLLALVIVSYNQGYPYVADLVKQYGRGWTAHLNAESADYLERILDYTELFQNSAASSR